MKKPYLIRQGGMLVNQVLIVGVLLYKNVHGKGITEENVFHFLLVTLLIFDSAWISYKNVRNDKVLNHFSYLMSLAAWQFFSSVFDRDVGFVFCSELLLPLVMYQTIYFLQLFWFQGSGYRYQKVCLGLLRLVSALSVCCRMVSVKWFWTAYFVQFLISVIIVLFLAFVHRKRIIFVIKSQSRELILASLFVVLPFACYITAFFREPDYLENLGGYLVIMISSASVHRMIFQKEKRAYDFVLNKKNQVYFLLISAAVFAAAAYGLGWEVSAVLIFAHCLSFLIQCYFLILYWQTVQVPEGFENLSDRNHFYQYSLSQMRREEELRKEFSNYLHDNILQDLLSVKNLMGKAERPEVRKLITDTLEQLNISIRARMQQYHPAYLKSMTLKENIKCQIEAVCSGFPGQSCSVCFDCEDNIFLVAPYDMILCRIIRELTVNGLKHSHSEKMQILLTQENGYISLKVMDCGKGFDIGAYDHGSHRGLASIQEQISLLDGNMKIHTSPGTGTEIIITMPMRGEDSYENFISR